MDANIDNPPLDEVLVEDVEMEDDGEEMDDDPGAEGEFEYKKGELPRVRTRAKDSSWARFVFEELLAYPSDYFRVKDKKDKMEIRKDISDALLLKHNIDKSEDKIKSAISLHLYKGKFPTGITGNSLQQDRNNWNVLVERAATAAAAASKATVWIGNLMHELVHHSENYFQVDVEDKKRIRKDIGASLLQHGIQKTDNDILAGINYHILERRRPPPSLNDDANCQGNCAILLERAADRKEQTYWYRLILKELSLQPKFFDMQTKIAAVELSKLLHDSYKIKRAARSVMRPISILLKVALSGKVPDWFSQEEQDQFQTVMDTLATSRWMTKGLKRPAVQKKSRSPIIQKVVGGGVQKKPQNAMRSALLKFFNNDGVDLAMDKARKEVKQVMTGSHLSKAYKKNTSIQKIVESEEDKKQRLEEKNKEQGKAAPELFDEDDRMDMTNEQVEFDLGKDEMPLLADRDVLVSDSPMEMEKNVEDLRKKIKEEVIREMNEITEARNEELRKAREEMKEATDGVDQKINQAVESTKEELRNANEEIAALRKEMQQIKDQKALGKEEEKIDPPFSGSKDHEVPERLKPLTKLKQKTIGDGKFTLTHIVGAGTFGIAFRAVEEQTGKIWAIKVVQDQISIFAELDDMQKLGDVSSSCRHLSVPSHSFSGAQEGVTFTAFKMELLQMDLHDLVLSDKHSSKTLPPASVLSILGQGFSALAFLNEKGFVYSDIKLDNIMIKTFKLRKIGPKQEQILYPEVLLIDLNMIFSINDAPNYCQAVCYRSPEIILSYNATEKIDSWSMGILALELLHKDVVLDIEYDGDEQIHEHIVLIEELTGKDFPDEMLNHKNINSDELPEDVPEDQPKMKDILDNIEPSAATCVLQHYIPELLEIDPMNRPSPSEAAEFLKDSILLP